jgi:hypothetical protein
MILKAYLGYKELYGDYPCENEFFGIIKSYSIASWFYLIDVLEELCHKQTDKFHTIAYQRNLINQLFPNSIKMRVTQALVTADSEERYPFHLSQLTLIKKIAVLFGHRDSKNIFSITPLPENVVSPVGSKPATGGRIKTSQCLCSMIAPREHFCKHDLSSGSSCL